LGSNVLLDIARFRSFSNSCKLLGCPCCNSSSSYDRIMHHCLGGVCPCCTPDGGTISPILAHRLREESHIKLSDLLNADFVTQVVNTTQNVLSLALMIKVVNGYSLDYYPLSDKKLCFVKPVDNCDYSVKLSYVNSFRRIVLIPNNKNFHVRSCKGVVEPLTAYWERINSVPISRVSSVDGRLSLRINIPGQVSGEDKTNLPTDLHDLSTGGCSMVD